MCEYDSILNTVKKSLNIDPSISDFDAEIIMHINSVLMGLTQIGVNNGKYFSISGFQETWFDYLGDIKNLEAIKSYVCLKTKLMFDPPQSGSVMEAFNKNIDELTFRISVTVDYGGLVFNE